MNKHLNFYTNFIAIEHLDKKEDLEKGLYLLSYAMDKVLNNENIIASENKILFSIKSKKIKQNLLKDFVAFFSQKFQIFKYKKDFNAIDEFDYYFATNRKINYLLQLDYEKETKKLMIFLYENNEFYNHELLKKLFLFLEKLDWDNALLSRDYHRQLCKLNKANLNLINLDLEINEILTSQINQNWLKIKRWRSEHLILKTQNKANYQIFSYINQKICDFFFLKKLWFFKKEKNKTSFVWNPLKVLNRRVISFKNSSNFDFKLNYWNPYSKLSESFLAFLLLNFLYEESRLMNKKFDNYYVVLSNDASPAFINFLEQINLKIEWYQNEKHYELLNNENCFFSYVEGKFNLNPKLNSYFDNYNFLIVFILMLNTYKNRNNLLLYKINQLQTLYGVYKNTQKHIKIKNLNFETLALKLDELRKLKNPLIEKINLIGTWNLNKFCIYKIELKHHSQIIIWFDPRKDEILIEFNLCLEYQNLNNLSLLKKLRIIILFYKLRKKIKNLLFNK